jgi:outer membrane protein assembly factor BamD
MPRRNFVVILYILTVGFTGCVEKELDPNDPKKSFGLAKEPFDDGYYEEAIKKLGEFKARFPYSQLATEAELLIADSQFNLERYQEAAAAYETFVKLHPNHPRADYSLYRIAESYWSDSPESPSREQDYTERAVLQWQEVIQKYPNTAFAVKAKDMIAKGRRRLAESVQLVARYYCKMEVWHSCAYRYTTLLDKYADQKDLVKEALEKAADALDKVAAAKDQDPASDKNLYHRAMTADQIREKAENFRRILKGQS